MFAFDGGAPKRLFPQPLYDDWHKDGGLAVLYRDATVARRHAEQAVRRVLACADADALREEWARSSLIADGLHLGGFHREANEIHDAHAARLRAVSPDAEAATPGMGSAPDSGTTATANVEETKAMANFAFDAGAEGSGGPWLVWSARGTQDGEIPGKSFYTRESTGKTPTDAPVKGIVLDIYSLKTGWQQSTGAPGVAPKWVWGDSPAHLPQKPGDDYKKGFSMRIALNGQSSADWEQAGAAVWNALAALMPAIQAGADGNRDKLPLVRMTGTEAMKFPTGTTIRPVLEIVKWVKRPPALADGPAPAAFDAGDDEPAPQPQRPAAPAPAPAMADDDFGDFS